jgi:exosome complex component RRP41
MTPDGRITLIQMDGNLKKTEFKEAIEMAKTGCMVIHEMQQAALVEKYSSQIEGENNE